MVYCVWIVGRVVLRFFLEIYDKSGKELILKKNRSGLN